MWNHSKNPDPKTVANSIMELVNAPDELKNLGMNARKKAQNYTLERWRAEIGTHLAGAWKQITV